MSHRPGEGGGRGVGRGLSLGQGEVGVVVTPKSKAWHRSKIRLSERKTKIFFGFSESEYLRYAAAKYD